jgi:ATP-dependent Clp protease ATP-binding subunit ClpA
MLSKELEGNLNDAFTYARNRNHEFLTLEHLLLALLGEQAAQAALQACNGNIEILREDLEEYVDATTPLIPQGQEDKETQPTLGFQRVLQRAVFHVQSSVSKKSMVPMYWLPSLVSKKAKRYFYCISKTLVV